MVFPKLTPILCVICFIFFVTFLPSDQLNYCDNKTLINSQFLPSDQFTVIINGYSDQRIPRLIRIAANYAASGSVSAVVVIWGNPTTAKETLISLDRNLSNLYSSSGAAVELIPQKTTSLNTRFIPGRWIRTRGVLICDDDIDVDLKSIEFVFKVWRVNQERLIGLFGRSHAFDLGKRSWMYTVDPNKYSIILTKFMMINVEYLYFYSCGEAFRKLRNVVDNMHNCEDILMNFVVSDVIERGPILVGAEQVRDWGDPRNEVEEEEEDVGLSGAKRGVGQHRKRRGGCIREFHKILGRMPLRYSYGKIVNSVSEQGLCRKRGGELVPCDQQI